MHSNGVSCHNAFFASNSDPKPRLVHVVAIRQVYSVLSQGCKQLLEVSPYYFLLIGLEASYL
jgi:hypothetical protein